MNTEVKFCRLCSRETVDLEKHKRTASHCIKLQKEYLNHKYGTGPRVVKCDICNKHINVALSEHEETRSHKTAMVIHAVAMKKLATINREYATRKSKWRQDPSLALISNKYCSFCDKHITVKNWRDHGKTQRHINNIAVAETYADNMNNLTVKDCPCCRVPFGDWREHRETTEHKLNEAEARLSALSAE